MDEPVPVYPKRPIPRDEDAAKVLKKRTLTNLYTPARSGWWMRTLPLMLPSQTLAAGRSTSFDDSALSELLSLNRVSAEPVNPGRRSHGYHR